MVDEVVPGKNIPLKNGGACSNVFEQVSCLNQSLCSDHITTNVMYIHQLRSIGVKHVTHIHTLFKKKLLGVIASRAVTA